MNKNINGAVEYLTVKQYAEKNEISVQAVYQSIWRKSLNAIKLGKTTLIPK